MPVTSSHPPVTSTSTRRMATLGSPSSDCSNNSTVIAVPMVSPGDRKPRSMSASQPPAEVIVPGSEAPPRPALPRLTRPSFDSASNKDLTMQLPRARRSRLHVPNRRKHSSTGSPVVAHSQSHGGSAQMCVVRRHGSTTVRTYRDPEQAPVRMQLTQSVRKSNDRRFVELGWSSNWPYHE